MIQIGGDADNIRYDKKLDMVFAGFGSGGIACIDLVKLELIYKINLPAHPESFQIDERKGLIFINVPGAGQMDVIDIEKKTVVEKINLNVKSNFPKALDTIHQVIYIGSRNPPKLILFDEFSLNMTSEYNLPDDADDIYYDSSDSLIFVSCGSGFINIFKQKDSKELILNERIKSSPGARTSLYVSRLNKLFITVPKNEFNKAKVVEYSIAH